tara:strand:+ start:2886 stop:3002 length:117 start_codon:yes stop_codon:yes gene_type:complete
MKNQKKISAAVLNQKHDVEFYLLINFAMGLSAALMTLL